ncbi:MAG: 2-C-methyl-D-erythritol 2,4-cyclodiphosphate synthase [Candidatus Omnitrophica bacterium]|nr:2-C-methyl-D-erythritol 2,4-cyclodiphosphate synthase [Candidatus Omnitrophota bacterium]
MRIGIGSDIHRLVKGRPLVIAGVKIPFAKGLLGHSDGDVLCHAIADAILGAMAFGDIGTHFPDNDSKWKGVSGLKILEETRKIAGRKKMKVRQVDSILVCQHPLLSPFRDEIQAGIAGALKIGVEMVGVKFKTNEGLAEIGKGQAISSLAVVVLSQHTRSK